MVSKTKVMTIHVEKIILRFIASTIFYVTETARPRTATYYVNRYLYKFLSARSNADFGYIRIPITSQTRPFHFPTYPEMNS